MAYLAAPDETGSPVPIGRGLGLVRARFRNSLRRPEMLVPGRIYEYTIDLWQTGRRIPAGWRLRLEISSSYAPTHSRNLNTGGNNEKDTQFVKAEQRIYDSATYPSGLLLSVANARD